MNQVAETTCGKSTFRWGAKTYVMGVVNVTPDSFSGDGTLDPAAAVARGVEMAANGADILDVGGESTRPGALPVDPREELRRVVPVIAGLAARVSVPISIDTSHAAVAEAALDAGAVIVNDVWGFRRDPDLAPIVARRGTCAVAMHNRSAEARHLEQLGGYFPEVDYDDVIASILKGLRSSIAILTEAGVPRERMIVDPGIGFGKTPAHNLEILARLQELRALGQPILIGPSRKSFIGITLGLPPDQRVEGTAAAVALGIRAGADIVRVHDLPAMARVARMADAIVRRPSSA
ncbi:MAG TPA: dihydropteroate synthase [Chloroflexota bacterium]|nr:dihydropteroate synthase [Chloroflexota bacterium]